MIVRTATPALSRVALAIVALGAAQTASAARVDIATVTASSTFPPEEGASYDPDKATDGKASTAWVEGESGGGLGAWLELSLAQPAPVTEVRVWAGLWYSRDLWERANRPGELEIALSDGQKIACALKDEMVVQACALPGTPTSSVKLKIKGVHDGTTWMDSAISEVQVIADGPGGPVPVVASAQSSALPSDSEATYDVANVHDGLIDTMWCEGTKDGDGTGEWIDLYFDRARPISKLQLVNGIGGSVKTWMLGNRATRITLVFDDESRVPLEVKNSARPQEIAFPVHTTKKVRILVDEVYKGKEYNDLCLSEAYFVE